MNSTVCNRFAVPRYALSKVTPVAGNIDFLFSARSTLAVLKASCKAA